eukprot:TRINITY_DN2326_c0_g1_i1.p3 TRINITY_DN2326_c0_g1~~TRINITY_DN2326_c0_g1_i1.p3  ORF type:complete len:123 (-),score=5.61 TRINITY_DN2326_c0_g1_i1:333-701(-)
MSDYENIANAFIQHYYQTFDNNRPNTASLYAEQAYMTFEGQQVAGNQAISQKLQSLPFQKCNHKVQVVDAQPLPSGGVIIFVQGQLLTEGETNPLRFSQVFHLASVGQSYVITNDVFRLIYG